MSAFRQLCRITVHHAYFPDGLCRKLAFIPTISTTAFMQRTGLLCNSMETGLQFFSEIGKLDALLLCFSDQEEGHNLVFRGVLKDTDFWYYTEPSPPGEGKILVFDNQRNMLIDGEYQRLHPGVHVSTNDWRPVNSPDFKSLPLREEHRGLSEFLIMIDLKPILMALDTSKTTKGQVEYLIHFNARKTLWRYYLVGVDPQRKLTIIDKNNSCAFREIPPETLPDGRMARSFISTQTLPITHQSTSIFQLKEQGESGEKMLIRRLPIALPNQQRHEVVNGQPVVFSDIFINC